MMSGEPRGSLFTKEQIESINEEELLSRIINVPTAMPLEEFSSIKPNCQKELKLPI